MNDWLLFLIAFAIPAGIVCFLYFTGNPMLIGSARAKARFEEKKRRRRR
jgi:hypothetical protein